MGTEEQRGRGAEEIIITPNPQSPMLQQIVDNSLKNHLYLSVHFNL
jgi:hypothetical protein